MSIVRGLVDRLGKKDRPIRTNESFGSMGLDELDLTELEGAIEIYFHKTLMTGIKQGDTIHSVVHRLQASV